MAIILALLCSAPGAQPFAAERQVTFSPQHHDLDENDNFSPDGRFLCFDTRETIGPGIDNCQSIGMVEVETGIETELYRPKVSVTGARPAPGVGAVSFSPVAMEVVFIHGPPVEELDLRGPYAKPNRNGALVPADGSGALRWLDYRDIATERPTLPGAHRGGTHRHEYSRNGKRIGFTYDDFLRQEYERTIGYMEPHPNAPAPASHYFALLVPVPPRGTAKPGEIERAYADSWVGHDGRMRAFIGKVRNDGGETYEESLFVVDVPPSVDITSADAGTATRFPAPPSGLTVRRLTHDWAGGTVRGSHDGTRIAYYGKDAAGVKQVFVIDAHGSDRAEDPGKRPIQATRFAADASFIRWHPNDRFLLCVSGGGVAAVCVEPGPRFGETNFLTPHGEGEARSRMVCAPDGRSVAYNQPVTVLDAKDRRITDYAGNDFLQVFTLPLPDSITDPR